MADLWPRHAKIWSPRPGFPIWAREKMVVRPDFEPTRTRSGPGDPDQIYFWPRSRFSGPDRKSTRTRENPTRTRENPIWPREIRSGPEKIRSGPEKIRSGPDAKFIWARRSGALWTRFFGDQNQVWPASPTRPPVRVTACAVDQTAFRT